MQASLVMTLVTLGTRLDLNNSLNANASFLTFNIAAEVNLSYNLNLYILDQLQVISSKIFIISVLCKKIKNAFIKNLDF